MKTIFQLFAAATLLLFLSGCTVTTHTADASKIMQYKITSFSSVDSAVSELNAKYGEKNVLIILDIDNTVLTSSVDLGGDIWYQWQTKKLAIKPAANQQVSCLFQDTIGLLYELLPMNLTEPNVPELIRRWQSTNTVFALTSRSPKYRSPTERELINKGINFEVAALAPLGKPAPVYREKLGREYSYMKGIMMTTGMHKGEMVDYILKKTKRHFDAIVFVDDTKKNIANVYNTLKNKKGVSAYLYHYVNIEKKREAAFGSVLTEQQAQKMFEDWTVLNQTLNSLFPQRAQGCLSTQ